MIIRQREGLDMKDFVGIWRTNHTERDGFADTLLSERIMQLEFVEMFKEDEFVNPLLMKQLYTWNSLDKKMKRATLCCVYDILMNYY